MAAKVDPILRQRILALVVSSSTGITVQELAASVSPKPDDRQLKQCVDDLVAAGIIVSSGAANPQFVALGSVSDDITASPQPPRSAPATAPTSPPPRVATSVTSTTRTAPSAIIENVTPAPVAATTAPAAAAIPPASDPDFAPMFDLAAPMVITALMSRSVATAALRMQALRNQKAGRVMSDYVAYALARLDALTPADAPNIGATADEILNWQQFSRS